MEANKLIAEIQKPSNNKATLRDHCIELENLIDYIDTENKYHYLLFLAEIYSTKLGEYQIAETFAQQVI
jgi:hypothetical protein